MTLTRRMIAGIAVALLAGASAASTTASAGDELWTSLRTDFFGDRQIETAGVPLKVVGPKRAEDAALVPVTVYVGAEVVPVAKTMTVIVDNNPVPLAATIHFADAYRAGANVGDRSIELRIRLDSLSQVRAVLETTEGRLVMASQFIAGSGGCSTTSLKDPDEALATLGQSRVKIVTDPTRGAHWREAQFQVRHPNFNGMQIDSRSGKYTPIHYINRFELASGTEPLLAIESSITISEDPNFRITYAGDDGDGVELVAHDSNGAIYRQLTQ